MKKENVIFTAHLPWPPSINNYYVQNRYTKRRSKKALEYVKKIEVVKQEQCLPSNIDLDLSIYMIFYPPDRKVRDIDNYTKGIFDALEYNKIIVNDKLFKEKYVLMHNISNPGRVLIICSHFNLDLIDDEKFIV